MGSPTPPISQTLSSLPALGPARLVARVVSKKLDFKENGASLHGRLPPDPKPPRNGPVQGCQQQDQDQAPSKWEFPFGPLSGQQRPVGMTLATRTTFLASVLPLPAQARSHLPWIYSFTVTYSSHQVSCNHAHNPPQLHFQSLGSGPWGLHLPPIWVRIPSCRYSSPRL